MPSGVSSQNTCSWEYVHNIFQSKKIIKSTEEKINENLLIALCPQIAVELFSKIQKAHEGKSAQILCHIHDFV